MSRTAKGSRVTLDDVAVRADVSPVTVSRVLRDPDRVSEPLRKRVDAAVRELGYIPNQMASALASSRTGRVAVIVPSLTNGVFDDYLRATHDIFLPAGIDVLLLNSNYASGREEQAIVTALGQHPEAIILAGIEQTGFAKRSLRQAAIPIVQTMDISPDPIDINIGLSHFDAGYAAARHLFDLGHRKVGYVAAPLDSRARKRSAGYLHAVHEFGAMPAIVSVDDPSSVTLGGSLFVELIERAPATTAVFCANDDLALGVLFECRRRGIRVPDAMSIIGFNDLEFSASASPSLSTVATPRYEVAQRAAEIILDIVRGSGKRPLPRQIDLGFRVIRRESTAPRTGV